MSLKINIEQKNHTIYTISPIGDINTETYQEFQNKINSIIALKPKAILLNMEGVKYISSLGLTTLFNAKKIIEEIGGSLIFTNLQPHIKKIFEVVKALSNLNVFESRQEADDYLLYIERKEIEKNKKN